MNFLADESVDRQIVMRLRQEGHHVAYVAEMEPGIDDEIVLKKAFEKQAVLLKACRSSIDRRRKWRIIHLLNVQTRS